MRDYLVTAVVILVLVLAAMCVVALLTVGVSVG